MEVLPENQMLLHFGSMDFCVIFLFVLKLEVLVWNGKEMRLAAKS